jgi:probable phosphoglycerate mutase
MRIAAIMRHAEPDHIADAVRTMASGHDAGLTERGRSQCEAARAWLEGFAPTRVIASPYPRAIETARLVGAPREPEIAEGFAGMRLGHWEDRPPDEVKEPLRRLVAGEIEPPPGAESIHALIDRVASAFADVTRGEGNVLIVAHRMVNAALLAPYLGLAPEEVLRVPQDHAGISLLSLEDTRDQVLAVNITPLQPLRLDRDRVDVF